MEKDFNIETLLDFKPPTFLCAKCFGLLFNAPIDFNNDIAKCPICNVEYEETQQYSYLNVGKFLESQNLKLQYKNLMEHGKLLAQQTSDFKGLLKEEGAFNPFLEFYSPMHGLLNTLSKAKNFVHIVSFGINHMLLGSLKMLSQNVSVRAIISNIDDNLEKEILNCAEEAPNLHIKYFKRDADVEQYAHQKIVVVDGLIAFKGPNFTNNGWRKTTKGLEDLIILGNVREVVKENNRLFSKTWANLSDSHSIQMQSFPY